MGYSWVLRFPFFVFVLESVSCDKSEPEYEDDCMFGILAGCLSPDVAAPSTLFQAYVSGEDDGGGKLDVSIDKKSFLIEVEAVALAAAPLCS